MGTFCVYTNSKEFKDTSKRLDIYPDSLEVCIHFFLNSPDFKEAYENTGEMPFPSDEQIREWFYPENQHSGREAIKFWASEYGDTDGFILRKDVDKAIDTYGTGGVTTYMNNSGTIVYKVSRPKITSKEDLKYLLQQLHIIDSNYNLLGIPMDKFYKRMDNLGIPTKLLSQVEMEIIKRASINNNTFMKAPNGKPTNLNERQWLQVRTKAFKDWFGDWENGLAVNQDDNSFYRGQFDEPYMDGNGNLILYGRKDSLYEKAGYKESKGVSVTRNLKSAIEYGEGQLETRVNLVMDNSMDESEQNAVIDNGYYLIQFKDSIPNEEIKEAGESKLIGDIMVPKGSYIIEHYVQGELIETIGDINNPNASKVVDENGEPLVVIHSNKGYYEDPISDLNTFELDSREGRYQVGLSYDNFYKLSDERKARLLSQNMVSFLREYIMLTQANHRLARERETLLNNAKAQYKRRKVVMNLYGDIENLQVYNPKQFSNNIVDTDVYPEEENNPKYEGIATTYFTTKEQLRYSSSYGEITGEFFLNIRNPFNAENATKDNRENYLRYNDFGTGNIKRKTLMRDGYDGATDYLSHRPEYVAFNPNQIKSATDNVGTFNKKNDNIYYQKSIVTELKKLRQLNLPLSKAGSVSKMKERLKRANLDPIISSAIIKAVETDGTLAALTPLEIFNLITRQQEKGIAQQYNDYIQKPINEALEQHLLDFLKPFHIEALEDGVVDKYGVTGLFDILNKVIHLAKAEDRNSITVTEEVAHAIVELLGAKQPNKEENKDYTFLYDNIENTDIYKQVYELYKDTYTKKNRNGEEVPNIAKIKKEAIGQALAVAINNKWENKYSESEKSFWDKLKLWIEKIFSYFADKDYINIDTLLNQIATEVIQKDYSRLKKVDSTNYSLLDYSESIANQNKLDGGKALKFMQFFSELGNIITGSIAYRKQGPVYRGRLDALHDIDMQVPLSVHKINLNSTILQLALKSRTNPVAIKEFLSNTDYFKKIIEKYPKLKIAAAYPNGKGGITVNAIYSEDESIVERFIALSGSYASRLDTFTEEERRKIYLFDFFILNEEEEEGILDPENNIRLSSWPFIFKAKLEMGRAKDIFDYQMWDVFEEYKSKVMSPEEYLMFQKSKENQYGEHESYITSKFFVRDNRLVSLYDSHKIKNTSDVEVPLNDVINIAAQDSNYNGVLDLLKEISKKHDKKMLSGVKVVLVNPNAVVGKYTVESRSRFESDSRAFYDAGKKTIYIDISRDFRNGNASSVIMHEIFHAITVDRILNNLNYREEFEKLVKAFNSQLKEGEGAPYMWEHAIEEFVADIWSNPQVISLLKNMSATTNSKKSLWERIKQFFTSVLFGGASELSLFAEASETLYNLLEEPLYDDSLTDEDIYFETEPLEREDVKTAIKSPLLSLLKKWEAIQEEHNNTIEFIENSHEYWYYPQGKEQTENKVKMETTVTTITNPINRPNRDKVGGTEYKEDGLGWLGVSGTIGTSADTIIRDFFQGEDITNKLYPNFNKPQLELLNKDLLNFKGYLDKKFLDSEYKVITSAFPLVGNVTLSDGTVVPVGGTPDIIIYDEEGNYYIYDIKTSRKDLHTKDTLNNYKSQVKIYSELLEAMHPELKNKCLGLGILYLDVMYPTPKNLTFNGKVGNTKYTVDDKGQLQANGKSIEDVKGYVAPHFPEGNVLKAIIEIDDINYEPLQFFIDKRKAPLKVTVSSLTVKKNVTQDKQSIHKNIDKATQVPKSDRHFSGRIEDSQFKEIINGTATSITKSDERVIEYYKLLKIGDTLELHNSDRNRSILVKVTKPLPRSTKEGKEYQLGIEYIPNSELIIEEDMKPSSRFAGNITISYPNNKDTKNTYTKGNPQKHPDTAFVFTENAQAHNSLEGNTKKVWPNVEVKLNVNARANQANIRTDAEGKKTENAFGLITKKFLLDSRGWATNRGCFKDKSENDMDFKTFTRMNTAMFEALEASLYNKVLFPSEIALGRAALPKRFAKWLQLQLQERYGIITSIEENTQDNYEGYGLRVLEIIDTTKRVTNTKAKEEISSEDNKLSEAILEFNSHFTTSTSGKYSTRTEENAKWADVTLALAKDFSTAGELETAKAAGATIGKGKIIKKGKKYISVTLNPTALSLESSSDRIAASIFELLDKLRKLDNIKLNIAGNGIYTLADSYTLEQLNYLLHSILKKLILNGVTIAEIRSGGQTGIDEAGIIAAQKIGIKWSVNAPKYWTFRVNEDIYNREYKDRVDSSNVYIKEDSHTVDISNEKLFKERFATSHILATESKLSETYPTVTQQLMDLLQEALSLLGLSVKNKADMEKFFAEHPNAGIQSITSIEDIRMFIGKKARTQFEQSLKKARPDMSDEEIQPTLDFLHSLEESKENSAYIKTAIKWVANRSITLPQDNTKARQAFDLARKKHLDLLKYSTLGELISSPEMLPKEKEKITFNPDEAKTFSNKQTVTTEGGRVFTVYDVENTEEGQREVCKALWANYEVSPWCLSTFTPKGEPTASAKKYWNQYNTLPRKIAFENGKPVAFSSSNTGNDFAGTLREWPVQRAKEGSNYILYAESPLAQHTFDKWVEEGIVRHGSLSSAFIVTEKGKKELSLYPEKEAWWDMEDKYPLDTLSDSIVSDSEAIGRELQAAQDEAMRQLVELLETELEHTWYTDDNTTGIFRDLFFFSTPEGEIYGFVDEEGNIYLDETVIDAEHPMHEYTHLWDKIIAKEKPELWKRGVELLKQSSLWETVEEAPNYGGNWKALLKEGKLTLEQYDNYIASEVHARLVGKNSKKTIEDLTKTDSKNLIDKIKKWLLDCWKELKVTFSNWSIEDLENLTLELFNVMPVRDFTELSLRKEVSTQAQSKPTVAESPETLTDSKVDIIGNNLDNLDALSLLSSDKPLHTEYELNLIKLRKDLNDLRGIQGGMFKPTELSDLAKACMYLVSDFISNIQSSKTKNEEYFKYLPDSISNIRETFINTDFTKLDRIEICNKLGNYMYEVIRQKYFNAKNNPNVLEMRMSTLSKLALINKNWNAFLELGQSVLARLEEIELDNSNVRLVNVSTEEFNNKSIEEIAELTGSAVEHWQVSFRLVSAHASLSLLIKRTIGTLMQRDKEGNPILFESGIPKRINESIAVNNILMWTQGSENLTDMVEKLKEQLKNHTWLGPIIAKLANSSEDETFKAQFWSNFKKYFQPYIIQFLKVTKVEGRVIDSVLTNKLINQRTLETLMLEDFTAIHQDRTSTPTTLFNSDGSYKEEILSLYKQDLGTLSKFLTDYKDNKEGIAAMTDREKIKAKAAIRRIYQCFEIDLDEDSVTMDDLISSYDNIQKIWLAGNKIADNSMRGKKKSPENLINNNTNNLKTLFNLVADSTTTTLESVAYEDGKLHYSYVVPSYLTNLLDKLKGNTENYEAFLEENFGKYEWFKDKSGNWRNEWLRVLATDETARRNLQHAVVLSTRSLGGSISVGYRDKSPLLYEKSMLLNYFYGGYKSDWAFYRVPIMSNKPSEEYIRFRRYISQNYKDDIAEMLIEVALLEIDRIATVRARNANPNIEAIKSFDKNGTKFLFLDYLQPILEEYLEWKKSHPAEELLYRKTESGKVSNARRLLGQMLELKIEGNENFDTTNDEKFRSLLKDTIKQEMHKKFEEYLADMKAEGLDEHLSDIKMLPDFEDNELTEEEKESYTSTTKSLENFFWNDTFAAINILQLTITDTAYYKDAEDLLKRLALIHAPGLRGNKEARWKINGEMKPIMDGKTRTFYISDFDNVVSDAIENIKQVFDNKVTALKKTNPQEAKALEEQAKHIIEAFESINVTDAQGYNSITSYRKKAIAFGKWSDELEEVYNKIRTGNYTTRDLEVIMLPLKPFIYSNTTKSSGVSDGRMTTLKVGMLNKNSEYLLLMMDAILLGDTSNSNPTKSKLAAIYQVMEESHYDANGNYKTDGIDTVQFNSTVKAGEMGVIDINNASTTQEAKQIIEDAIYKDANNKSLGYNLDRVHELNFDDYCLQNEVPAHLEGESIFGSQMRILAISDMPEVVGGIEQTIWFRGKKTLLREVKLNYMQAIVDNIKESLEELAEEFNIKGTQAQRNVALSRLLQELIKKDGRFGYDLLYSVCTDEKGNFIIPINDPINAGRIQLLLHSIIKNRINKQMIDGGPVVQVTNFGTSAELDIVFKDANNKRLPTLREWYKKTIKDSEKFAKEFEEWDTSEEYTIPSYEEFAKMHRYKTAKEGTREYMLYHELYLPLREVVSSRFKEEVASKQAGIMYIECYAPSTIFTKFADDNGIIDLNKIPDSMKELVGFRIPTEFKYSMAPLKIVGLLPKESGEGIMLPKDITILSGSDFDEHKLR